MWKIVTNSNLNPPLKLFFYSPILTNNNLLFKIYCKNIVVVFPFFHPYVSFFFLFFFLHHTQIPIYLILSSLFFSLLSTSRTSLSISFSNSLPFYSFSFLFLPLSSNTHRHAWRERRSHPYSTTPPPLLFHHTHTSLFFFLIFYCCSIFFFFLCS